MIQDQIYFNQGKKEGKHSLNQPQNEEDSFSHELDQEEEEEGPMSDHSQISPSGSGRNKTGISVISSKADLDVYVKLGLKRLRSLGMHATLGNSMLAGYVDKLIGSGDSLVLGKKKFVEDISSILGSDLHFTHELLFRLMFNIEELSALKRFILISTDEELMSSSPHLLMDSLFPGNFESASTYNSDLGKFLRKQVLAGPKKGIIFSLVSKYGSQFM
jgi:hypothetical protein